LKLLEYEAKEYFRRFNIPVPEGKVISRPGEVTQVVEELKGPVVIKAQVPAGGRGKAGGIKFAETPEEAFTIAEDLLGSKIKDIEIERLLVERRVQVMNEIYAGITVDRTRNTYVFLVSSEGGIDIEEVASEAPEKIVKFPIASLSGFRSYHANNLARGIGYHGRNLTRLSRILVNLFNLAWDMDAELTEINPLVETSDGFMAVDARLNIDNNSLFRHPELQDRLQGDPLGELTEKELEARNKGLTYVELTGNIGIIGNGAGLTMATLDTVKLFGGKPGNFLDLGGGASAGNVEKAVKFIYQDERMEALFVNILGGITRCDDIAKGIVNAREEQGGKKPIVVRMMGTNEEEGKRILAEAGIAALDSMEEAAEKVVTLVGGK
jgi:succinyl-CoA synthetase beta subunit